MSYKQSTLKKLWAASGNQCGYPDCENEVVDIETETVVGEICHIRAQSEGGPRYDPSLSDEEIDEYSNLILLCPTHHTHIDKNPEDYPIEELERWKKEQEAMSTSPTELSDQLLTELQLTDSKFETEVEVTISNAKDRYNPELHVDTGNSDIFEPLGRTDEFDASVQSRLDDLDEEASSLFTERYNSILKDVDKDAFQNLREAVDKIPEVLGSIDEVSARIPFNDLQQALDQAEESIQDLEPGLRQKDEEASMEDPGNHILYHFRQVRTEIYNLQNFVESRELRVAEASGLKLLGDAGIGKTHTLCNVARSRVEEGYPTVFLLGENFADQDIWTQIIDRFGLNCTTDDFLSALNSLGESRGVRSLILIDALNESLTPRIWPKRLPGVLRKLEGYPYVGICVSCRSGYEDLVLPDAIDEGQLVEAWHGGFSKVEYEAVRTFFDAHGIEHSSIPVLKREFQVPLFLKLFCENLERKGKSRVSHGSEGLTEIFEGYIDGVHERLWRELDYDPGVNKVQQAVNDLAQEMAERGDGTKRLPKQDAKEIVDNLLPRRSYSESLYRHMLSEGVISEVASFNEDNGESVRFSYDKFADHKLAQQYLDLYVDENLERGFSENDELQELFDKPNLYAGLIQAFAIHLPEQHDVELFDLVESSEILRPVIKSLGWRDPDSLTTPEGELKKEVHDYLWSEIELLDEVNELWRVLLTLATSTDHPLNAEYLHEVLWDQPIAGRDNNWSKFLHGEFDEETSEVFRLINWGFSLEHEPVESEELKRLMSISLSWFFSCPNRYVRDRATKSLVNVVGSDLRVYIDLIERFQGVNDPYILERVYAAAYGGVLRNRQQESAAEVAEFVYESEFENENPVPNVLSRDYARGIIEAVVNLDRDFDVDIDRVRPPYNSAFSIDIPDSEELEDLVTERLEEADYEVEAKFWYGLAGSGFEGDGRSDFARYVLDTNHDSSHVHGYDISGEEALRWITKRVFELGWDPDLFGEFEHYLNRWSNHGRGTRKPEKFSKKYQWIAYHELIAWVVDNCGIADSSREEPYNGPWVQWDRNIDPSVLSPELDAELSLDDVIEYDCRIEDEPIEEWIQNHDEFPSVDSMLDVSVDGEGWVPLYGMYKWKAEEGGDSEIERDVFCRIDPVVVDQEDKQELVDWITEGWVKSEEIRSTLGSLPTLTQVFRGEYPWHPIVEDRWEGDSSIIIGSSVDIEHTAIDLFWEAEYDCSINEKYGMYAPSPYLADLLDLEWRVGTMQFTQSGPDPVCVADISEARGVHDRINSMSMIGASDNILDELEAEGLDIVWPVQGEKRVISTGMGGNQMGKSQIRAVYYLDDKGEFTGTVETDFHSWE
ncbi:HNH endonuclease [Natrialba taiwanensis]|uniref:HNH endonuclease n=1 Tax=Natrialba taiwanensis TaxID=160846 RepID=UPI00135F17F4|nr:HNH endonuclease [Natrialba taiwanensis]